MSVRRSACHARASTHRASVWLRLRGPQLHALAQSRGRLLVVGAKVREGEDKARRAGLATTKARSGIEDAVTYTARSNSVWEGLTPAPRGNPLCPRRMEPAGPTAVARSGIRKKTVSPTSSVVVEAARAKQRLESKFSETEDETGAAS
jgi:hypothetical protein